MDDPNNVEADPSAFIEIGNRGTQSTVEAMDRNGNLFFGLLRPVAVGCWDSTLSSNDSSAAYNANNIRVVVQNSQTLQFIFGMKVVLNDQNREELWVLSNRYQVRGSQEPSKLYDNPFWLCIN